jgi:4-aminobutyrate aminotransferase/(S)-3-amino-2-methylpropionate transaminase
MRTPAPGPRAADIQQERERWVPRGVSTYHPIYPVRAEGAELEDADGNRYLDFAGGIGAMNVGHSHPTVVEAIQRQAERYTHTCAHVAMPDLYVRVAQRLAECAPGPSPKKTLLVNSGAEAVENAIKIARAATGRPGVIAFENSFHGRTLMALTLTGRVRPYTVGFGPFAGEVYHVPYPYCYRCPADVGSSPDGVCCGHPLASLRRALETRVAADQVAAVIVEPVLGEGGFVVPPADFLPALAEFCRIHGILLIADEVQTGFGRTGRMWACEHASIEPDLLVTAKSLAAGLPLAAVIGRAELMDAPAPGGLGGTYGGNPVACAAALAVLDVFEREGLVARAEALGAVALGRMREWSARMPLVGDARGLGAMVAVELVCDRTSRAPATAEAAAVVAACRSAGLLLIKAGLYDNVIRLLMPLVTTDEQLAVGLDILERALGASNAGLRGA